MTIAQYFEEKTKESWATQGAEAIGRVKAEWTDCYDRKEAAKQGASRSTSRSPAANKAIKREREALGSTFRNRLQRHGIFDSGGPAPDWNLQAPVQVLHLILPE